MNSRRNILRWLLAGLATIPLTLRAEPVVFFVDTSASMTRLAASARQCVRDVIRGGIDGHVESGDPIVVATFNDRLNPRPALTLEWDPNLNEALGRSAFEFLNALRHERQSQLAPVLEDIERLAAAFPSAVVFLISDGSQPVRGTPIDRSINAIFSQTARALRREGKALVTTWVIRDHRVAATTLNASDESITIPAPALASVPVAPPVQVMARLPEPEPVKAFVPTLTFSPRSVISVPVIPPAAKAPAAAIPPAVTAGGAAAPVSTLANEATPENAGQNPVPAKAESEPPSAAEPVAGALLPAMAVRVPESRGATAGYYARGAMLLLIIAGFVALLIGANRRASRPSLISQSIDRRV